MDQLLPRGCKFEWTGQNLRIKFRGRYVVSKETGERKYIEVGANYFEVGANYFEVGANYFEVGANYFVGALAFARRFEAGDEPEYVLENAFPNGTPQVT